MIDSVGPMRLCTISNLRLLRAARKILSCANQPLLQNPWTPLLTSSSPISYHVVAAMMSRGSSSELPFAVMLERKLAIAEAYNAGKLASCMMHPHFACTIKMGITTLTKKRRRHPAPWYVTDGFVLRPGYARVKPNLNMHST